MRVPQSLWSAKNRVSRCTSMRVGRLWNYIVTSEAHNPGHIYKVTTWWGVSVCKKSKAKQNKQIKKSDNRKPFLLAGDQLIIWLESFGSQDSCEGAKDVLFGRGRIREGETALVVDSRMIGSCWRQKVYFLDDGWRDTVYRRALLLEYDVIHIENYKNAKYLELRPTEST